MASYKSITQKLRMMYQVTSSIIYTIAPWTTGDQVECNDGKTVQAKIGNIDGISDSITSNSSRIAVSQKALYDLKNSILTEIGNAIDDAIGGNY